MPNLKDIKIRINSVVKTRQITQAMKLVATAKLKGATERALAAKPYQEALRKALARVVGSGGADISSPLLRQSTQVQRVLLVCFTSDRGLCGGFNNILMRRTMAWLAERHAQKIEVDIHVYGRKGRDFLNGRRMKAANAVIDYAKTPRIELVRPLSDVLEAGFGEGRYDEVWVAYNVFKNAATQVPAFARVLPLSVEAGEESASAEYTYEPGATELLGAMLPMYLRGQLLQAFLETEAGEYGARMLAMDNATRNASELIKRLTLQYNRARQAAITTEITEIVSGAEAL
ncbi:MAG TPA: ATP synthase F1 subunit gamma [Myxococcota bacterium]|nr:ATP synthase F1 subunit gamma [Myxococcota bacterium]